MFRTNPRVKKLFKIEPPFPSPKQNKVLLTIDLTHQVLEEALSDPKVG
jgi:hypothetical protein